MNTTSFEQTLFAARRLTPQERARLIAQLATELVAPSEPPASTTAADAWTQMQQFRQEFSQLYPDARLATRLDADRQEREAGLSRNKAEGDVQTPAQTLGGFVSPSKP